MNKIAFLNSSSIDFDSQLDFSPLMKLGEFSSYNVTSEQEILEKVIDQNIVITKELPLPKHLIEQFPPSVKLICEAGTGYNNIDLPAAKEKGILVCNVPGYSTEAVAQLAITFILNLNSSIIQQQRMIERDNFSNFTQNLQVPHFEIQNKTLGLIGTGAIGNQVMSIARALGMDVLTYSRTPKNFDDPRIKSVSLDELLSQSDFVSIHCPLTAETKHLIDMDKLKLMKPTAFIINTARGAIIKEVDLIEALEKGIIAGAGLDVQDPEPPQLDNPLFAMDNVILTPHIGWKTLESRQRLVQISAENIQAFLTNQPVNIVNS
ncbi:2-hydroxyacid dehydrogenase [Amphibacillus xylanus]|uniref:Oxidoreductase n=1 Tax=Amphibacillus xylanus (strain ATCC 51415 / DSM 6626 / JCM 7361 / LMG 17667 / NBRC 15112 / Ep01) TaxID=698758 RepID=K0J2E5_AMPXN|nr:NAD(P)-dependent oxidoreductase [Amphibacillus xylanus]BAM46651.1 oxidoreductase [Amphibacillus xylanus NBRC 15112]